MKLGLVIYGSLEQRSGGYLYDRMLAQQLRSMGDQVELLSIPLRRYAGNLVAGLSNRLTRRFGELDLDLIVEDELCHPSLLLVNRRVRGRVPIVAIVHHLRASEPHHPLPGALYRTVERSFLRTLDGAVFNSEVTRHEVRAVVGRSLPGVVALPGRDHLKADIQQDAIRQRAVDEGPLQVLFVGNLIPRKGLHLLIKALERLPTEQWQLTVVGSTEFDRSYSNSIRQDLQRLNGNVRLAGSLPHTELRGLLLGSHLMVIPSYYEGFGIAYLEGMGFGLPAIGTTAGGASDFVRDGENGYLVSPGDIAALSERLTLLATDRVTLARLGTQALDDYGTHPTWADSAAKIREFLSGVVRRSVSD